MTETTNRLISRADLARMLGVTTRTLENWEKDGYGPKARRLKGRSVRYSMHEVEGFLLDLPTLSQAAS